MLTAALLLLFTLLCIMLSADRAWDNVTKPERNALVFDGRHRDYGAFVLRREYDRRFILAFFSAVGLFGSAVMVPKVLAAFGLLTSSVVEVPHRAGIDVTFEDIMIPPAPQPPQPERAATPPAGKPVASENPEIVIVPKDSLPKTAPGPIVTPDPGPPNPGPGGDPAPKGPAPGTGGTTPGTTLGTSTNPFSAAEVKLMPKFPGGDEAMVRFVQDNIRLPEFDDAGKKKEWVEFVVDENGNVVRVRSKGRSDKAFSQAAEQVVRSMPQWTPAVLENGDKVACWLVLPIQYETR